MVFELLETDLNIKEDALIQVAILKNNHSRDKLIVYNKVTLKLMENAEYSFELIGNSKENLKLKRID